MRDAAKILDSELERLNPNSFIQVFYKTNRSKILDIIKTIQNDAYNQAVDDAARNAHIEEILMEETDSGRTYEYRLDKNSILILKKK